MEIACWMQVEASKWFGLVLKGVIKTGFGLQRLKITNSFGLQRRLFHWALLGKKCHHFLFSEKNSEINFIDNFTVFCSNTARCLFIVCSLVLEIGSFCLCQNLYKLSTLPDFYSLVYRSSNYIGLGSVEIWNNRVYSDVLTVWCQSHLGRLQSGRGRLTSCDTAGVECPTLAGSCRLRQTADTYDQGARWCLRAG